MQILKIKDQEINLVNGNIAIVHENDEYILLEQAIGYPSKKELSISIRGVIEKEDKKELIYSYINNNSIYYKSANSGKILRVSPIYNRGESRQVLFSNSTKDIFAFEWDSYKGCFKYFSLLTGIEDTMGVDSIKKYPHDFYLESNKEFFGVTRCLTGEIDSRIESVRDNIPTEFDESRNSGHKMYDFYLQDNRFIVKKLSDGVFDTTNGKELLNIDKYNPDLLEDFIELRRYNSLEKEIYKISIERTESKYIICLWDISANKPFTIFALKDGMWSPDVSDKVSVKDICKGLYENKDGRLLIWVNSFPFNKMVDIRTGETVLKDLSISLGGRGEGFIHLGCKDYFVTSDNNIKTFYSFDYVTLDHSMLLKREFNSKLELNDSFLFDNPQINGLNYNKNGIILYVNPTYYSKGKHTENTKNGSIFIPISKKDISVYELDMIKKVL